MGGCGPSPPGTATAAPRHTITGYGPRAHTLVLPGFSVWAPADLRAALEALLSRPLWRFSPATGIIFPFPPVLYNFARMSGEADVENICN